MTDAPPIWRSFHDNTPVEVKGHIRPAVADVYGFTVLTTHHAGSDWLWDVEAHFHWLRGRRPRSGDVYLMGPLQTGDGHEVRWAFAPGQGELARRFRSAFRN